MAGNHSMEGTEGEPPLPKSHPQQQIREDKGADLEQMAAKLAAIVESSEDAIISKTLDGIIETWNHGAEMIFGYADEEVIGKPITVLIPEDLHDEEMHILERIKRGERILHYRTARVTKSGKRIDVSLSVSPVRDEVGNIIGSASITRDITEYGIAEAALRASEARYKTLFDMAPDAILLIDEGVFLDCNPKGFELFGCKGKEIIGERPWQLSPPVQPDGRSSKEKAAEKIEAALRGEPQFFEWRHCRVDGSEFDAVVTLSHVEIERHPMLFANVRDITERKQNERARQRQAEFDTLITTILARFASCSGPAIDEQVQKSLEETGRFIEADSAFVVLFAPDMATWSAAYESTAPGIKPFIHQYQNVPIGIRPWTEQKLLVGDIVKIDRVDELPPEAASEKQFLEDDGVKSTLLLPLRANSEQLVGVVGLRSYNRPITWLPEDIRRLRLIADAIANTLERKRVEGELYASQQMLQQILDTIPQRVFWKNLDSIYLGCNKSFAKDINLADTKEVLGKSDFEYLFGAEFAARYRADDKQVMETGVAKIGYEEQQLRKDGTMAWLRTSKIPLRDQQNRIFGILGTYEDITDLRNAREGLLRAKEAAETANRAKDQFIAVLSHELRTPLTPVLATVTALRETERLPAWVREDMEVIQRNVEMEARLIDDLLDITRIAQGKITLRREALDAHSCIESALEICEKEAEAKQLEILLKLDAKESFVSADPTRLRQVFWNLFNNAIKFTPEQGRIEVRTINSSHRIIIEFADTGIGIEPEAQKRIFHVFEQGERTPERQFGGLGLGLSIAKTLVEMHQGTLTAQSEGKGKGAVFTVELPTVPPVAGPTKPAEISQSHTTEACRILLVDDHEDTLRILARLLRKWGYGVTVARNVASALERASEQKFDLLVSDLGLPDGSGRDVARELKKRYGLESIALSGYGTDEDIRASMEAGFAEHLTKPVSFQALQTAVERLLKKRS